MKQRFETLEQANIFIDKVNILLWLPNEVNGTLTYSIPELVEIKENDVVVETYYEIPITEELDRILNPEKYVIEDTEIIQQFTT